MEVASYISAGAAVAFVISKIMIFLEYWHSSPAVEQIVKRAIQIRESLPPILVKVGANAIVLVKYIVSALVEVFKSLPPALVKTIHLVLHVVFQVGVFLKNVYHIGMLVGRSFYIALDLINKGFDGFWNLSETLTSWMHSSPVSGSGWPLVLKSIVVVLAVSWILKKILQKTKHKEN